jgi:oxygen-independent coproporphyrinogen-3 oxidase
VPDFGVYIHVPFCARRCDYCAFATYDDRDDLREPYVEALISEIVSATEAGLPAATSIFVGGGTPSRLEADDLVRIIQTVPQREGCEITVECNPEDASLERLVTYRRGGVTRMSYGVQSTNPATLADLGRRHGIHHHAEVAARTVEAGFTTFNMDLIVGSTADTLDTIRQSVLDLISLPTPPPHIACYALTPEPATPLGRDPSRHPDEDATADAYDLVGQMLAEAGYEWEEISNWAKPGHACRHNHLYWQRGNYRGFGSAAHSHVDGRRFWNVRTPNRYIEMCQRGEEPLGGEEFVDAAAQLFEAESLALRTRHGVARSAFDDLSEVEHLVDVDGDVVCLRPEGRLIANRVILKLRSAQDGAEG